MYQRSIISIELASMHRSSVLQEIRLYWQWLYDRQCCYTAVKIQAMAIDAIKNTNGMKMSTIQDEKVYIDLKLTLPSHRELRVNAFRVVYIKLLDKCPFELRLVRRQQVEICHITTKRTPNIHLLLRLSLAPDGWPYFSEKVVEVVENSINLRDFETKNWLNTHNIAAGNNCTDQNPHRYH